MTATHEILNRLIAFDTVSANSNLDLAAYVEAYLADLGVTCDRVPNGTGDKIALLASIGPTRPGGVVLSAHTDVVPAEGQSWTRDPFALTFEEGRAYGRGTADMKAFLASVLAAVPQLVAANLQSPVHLAFSYDEEVGCAGVQPLIAHMLDRGLAPGACIVGEPTGMTPVTAHTGKQIFTCTFKGTPMHSSLSPRGVNAIAEAGEAIARLNDLSRELLTETTNDLRFPIPHPTINFGTIEGGKATNIVAEDCAFVIEYRYPPGTSPDLLRRALEGLGDRDPAPQVTEVVSYPAFTAPTRSKALELVTGIVGTNATLAVNYGTEAGHYSSAGIDTVVFGPGDIAQAHQPDEFITLSQLDACDRFLAGLCDALSRGD
ncbi:acetylornithine deacetylase [uncultured Ruegeria sp.]|uniref:acetylornithine deacetylase n=1 Tax=uncultured Ruegeria sp. TaxID=259304 RepID=UPI0026119FAB|nr:acetylornithine deacetylase [uncultured Ruegeria sp.]